MLRYRYGDVYGNQAGSRQSSEVVVLLRAPCVELVSADWGEQIIWSMFNTNWDMQSRESTITLRPPNAWIMHTGFRCRSGFRAVAPSAITERLGTAPSLYGASAGGLPTLISRV